MELLIDIKKKLSDFQLNVKFAAWSQTVGLLGASGAGKTMTLRCIAGIEKPDSGRIVLNGRVLFDSDQGINLPPQKRNIGLLFQNYALFPHMTVAENIGFGLERLSRMKRNEAVKRQIEMMKLSGLEKRYPAQLSGGQQQRVALARALVTDPNTLLLDEPFSALDTYLRIHMVNQLKETLDNYHGVTIFVSHNMEDIHSICNKLVLLADGQVEAKGTKDSVLSRSLSLTSALITEWSNV